jgi:apolipoprotein N-acyltransferase
VQLAAVLGTSGITFLLLLVPSAVASATLSMAARDRGRLAWTTAAAVTLALGYGAWRLVLEEPARASVTVGLVAADRPEQPARGGTDEGQRVVAQYAKASEALAARGAQVIVLPETILQLTDPGVAALQGRFAGLTESRGVTVAVGVDRLDPEGEANTAIAFLPGRGEPAVYAKQHLLLPPESRFRPGSELTLLDSRWGTLGLAICKDMDFPRLGRRYAERGASMLLVPAWDFTADGWLHSRMAVLRGVEGGFTVARAARGGRLTISDDRGRIIAEAASASAPVASVLAEVRLRQAGTPYARLGDWFAWLAGGVFTLALVTAVRAGSAREVVKP